MAKSPDAFRTISEVSTWLDTPAHVLRFWESKFSQIKPVKRAGGRRYYRPDDMDLLGGIKTLLHDQGMTIKGVQKLLREKGIKHVAGFGPSPMDDVIDGTVVTPVATSVPETATVVAAAPTIAATPVMPPKPDVVPAKEDEPEPVPHHRDSARTVWLADFMRNLPDDPADEDFNPRSRFQSAFQRASGDRLAAEAAKIAPLVARLQSVRARMGRD